MFKILCVQFGWFSFHNSSIPVCYFNHCFSYVWARMHQEKVGLCVFGTGAAQRGVTIVVDFWHSCPSLQGGIKIVSRFLAPLRRVQCPPDRDTRSVFSLESLRMTRYFLKGFLKTDTSCFRFKQANGVTRQTCNQSRRAAVMYQRLILYFRMKYLNLEGLFSKKYAFFYQSHCDSCFHRCISFHHWSPPCLLFTASGYNGNKLMDA